MHYADSVQFYLPETLHSYISLIIKGYRQPGHHMKDVTCPFYRHCADLVLRRFYCFWPVSQIVPGWGFWSVVCCRIFDKTWYLHDSTYLHKAHVREGCTPARHFNAWDAKGPDVSRRAIPFCLHILSWEQKLRCAISRRVVHVRQFPYKMVACDLPVQCMCTNIYLLQITCRVGQIHKCIHFTAV